LNLYGTLFVQTVLVHRTWFEIGISATTEDAPKAYLFTCPVNKLQTGLLLFGWPDCPAYWSIDTAGVERLGTDAASQLGFPSLKLTTYAWGRSWDVSVYAGLRQFHQTKGLDPDSQDVACHLDFPIYELSDEMKSPFVYGEPQFFRKIITSVSDIMKWWWMLRIPV
jgi:hypothetical protein